MITTTTNTITVVIYIIIIIIIITSSSSSVAVWAQVLRLETKVSRMLVQRHSICGGLRLMCERVLLTCIEILLPYFTFRDTIEFRIMSHTIQGFLAVIYDVEDHYRIEQEQHQLLAITEDFLEHIHYEFGRFEESETLAELVAAQDMWIDHLQK